MPTNKPEVVLPEAPPIPAHLFDKDQSIVWAAAWETLRKHVADTLTRPADGDFVMVPREATREIISAMLESRASDEESEFPALMDLIDFSGQNKNHAVMRAAYRAMLSAAPQQHGQEVGEVERLREQMEIVWRYLQKVSPWHASNDMLWCDEIMVGIDLLAQQASQPQQPAEAVAAIPSASTIASTIWRDWMTNEQADRLGADIHRWLLAYAALFCPPPAIDIQQPAEAVAEYQYRKPGARDDSWHRMTREEYEASLATGHCCGMASWTKNVELRKLYTTPTTDQQGGREVDAGLVAWLEKRGLMPDAPDGTVDMADIIQALDDHERELMQPQQPAEAVAGEFRECPHCKGWSRTQPPAIDIGKLRVLVAKAIYSQWTFMPGWVEWVENGNSIRQDDARQLAQAHIDASGINAALIGDGGEDKQP